MENFKKNIKGITLIALIITIVILIIITGVTLNITLLDNGLFNKWNIVFTNDGNNYGTGWNYVEKGTYLDGYGSLKNNWLVNIKTKEIIKLEEGTYDKLNYKDSVAITDNLALNIDASNLEAGNWEGIEKHGTIDYDEDNRGIRFDNNDYLKLTKSVNFLIKPF